MSHSVAYDKRFKIFLYLLNVTSRNILPNNAVTSNVSAGFTK